MHVELGGLFYDLWKTFEPAVIAAEAPETPGGPWVTVKCQEDSGSEPASTPRGAEPDDLQMLTRKHKDRKRKARKRASLYSTATSSATTHVPHVAKPSFPPPPLPRVLQPHQPKGLPPQNLIIGAPCQPQMTPGPNAPQSQGTTIPAVTWSHFASCHWDQLTIPPLRRPT